MSVLDILYSICIMPLQLFFEIIFTMANKVIDNPGLSIIVLSLAMNFLVLPLYRRADAMQEEERNIEAKLHYGVKHIKKTFKGDERMMILNTYYRQNGYKPTYVFRGAISLFLEIPFFIAAYQFLSHLDILRGVSFGILQNLGAADQLITVGKYHMNLLPMIMTVVNLVSCVIFTKGYPIKTKVQLYSMAIFFFFFLYESPSGLVFYWTLNNIFSLVKTIFYKLKNPRKLLRLIFAIAGVALIAFAINTLRMVSIRKFLGVVFVGITFLLPLLVSILKKKYKWKNKQLQLSANSKMFWMGALFLIILIGCVIPSAVIKASPQEFVDMYNYSHPLWYICNSLCLAIGTFGVWFGVFYSLADQKTRVYFDVIMWVFSGVAIVNYMFFGKHLGLLNSVLKYESGMNFSSTEKLENIGFLLVLIIFLFIIFYFLQNQMVQIFVIGTLALCGVAIVNISSINKSMDGVAELVAQEQEKMPSFTLSKKGKNVVMLMLDRSINEFVPYIMHEKPELKKIFSGFTYYSNTVSFGGHTNIATPALYGGYEYTPYEMNKRDSESLQLKHNEALKVMPVLFEENGYNVTVCDPSYANYQWIPDISIYDEYKDINAYITSGRFMDEQEQKKIIKNNRRNFFCYSLMKTLPICVQPIFYDAGNYNHLESTRQTVVNDYIADGIFDGFMNAYTVLENLSNMSNITDDGQNTFLMMANDTTHNTMLLQEPEYVPTEHVDNTEYDREHAIRLSDDGQELKLENLTQMVHYQSDMAALIQIGQWLTYLKKNEVYDNTRIIIVADHGADLGIMKDMKLQDEDIYDAEFYYPLLMVKDFDSEEFTTSNELMTNGDVPTIAVEGIIEHPVNPFTGKELNNNAKNEEPLYVLASNSYDVLINNGNQYEPGAWLSVKDDVTQKKNWTILQSNSIFPVEK